MSLPIDRIRPDFERSLDANRRLVVTAETGAGKSTRVPVWLAERCDGLILVVEPRRVACHALAEFLAAERGEPVGGFFGSRVRFSDRSSADTRVLFCTPGVALRMLAGPLRLGALVVDEFHERSWQIDLVVAAAQSLPAHQDLPLVVTSATIDAEAAAAVLGAETLHAEGRTFPVEVRYAGDASIGPHTDGIGPRVADAVTAALRENAGDVLVFLPGIQEIRAVEAALGPRDEETLTVHGSQPPEAMRRVFETSTRRRIYLATNVAETSITLPGVRIVVDSGLAKTRMHRAGRAVLATAPISAASMQQRAGRAGRTAAGLCIRLWSERFRPEPYQRPEIERVDLDDLLLQAAELGLQGETLAAATWVTPPPAFAIERAAARLASLGALGEQGLTDRGRALARLPVSAQEAALLVGAPAALGGTICDLVAILQARGSLLRDVRDLRGGERDAAAAARAALLAGLTDEVTTSLVLLREGSAKRHHLSGRRLDEARTVARQLRELTGARGDSLDGLAGYIVSRLPEAGFVRRPRASKARGRTEPWANGAIEVQVQPFTPVDEQVEAPKFDAAAILETDWLTTHQGVVGYGRMVLPTDRRTLADAGLGEVRLGEVQLDKGPRGQVHIRAAREVQLAGVTLASDEAPLEGPQLHRTVAELVLANRLFKGCRDALLDALHGWRILAQWRGEPLDAHPNVPGPDSAEPVEWLAQRIGDLGVETDADLALLEAADLVPDLEAATGIPRFEFQPVLDDFPRLWTDRGGTYTCTVQPGNRRVQLEPFDAAARKLKEPSASALPRFRGFAVVYQQGSRRVPLR